MTTAAPTPDTTSVDDAPELAHTGARRRSTSLSEAADEFRRHGSPWIIGTFLTAAVVARAVVGGFSWVDLAIVVVAFAIQPFVEWVLHTSVLHWRPRSILGLTIDPLVARKHRAHHVDPQDVDLVFIPVPVLVQLVVAEVVIALLVAPRAGLALTYLTTIGLVGMIYEWSHFLIHSDYRPKTRLYRTLWRNHRLHHYKNENFWMTVTNPLADHVFGTAPDVASVPTSPTVRDLLGRETAMDRPTAGT